MTSAEVVIICPDLSIYIPSLKLKYSSPWSIDWISNIMWYLELYVYQSLFSHYEKPHMEILSHHPPLALKKTQLRRPRYEAIPPAHGTGICRSYTEGAHNSQLCRDEITPAHYGSMGRFVYLPTFAIKMNQMYGKSLDWLWSCENISNL